MDQTSYDRGRNGKGDYADFTIGLYNAPDFAMSNMMEGC